MKTTQTNKKVGWLTRFKASASRTIPYIKLKTKLAFTNEKRSSIKSNIIHWTFVALIFAILLFIGWYLTQSLLSQSLKYVQPRDIPIVIFTVAELFIFIYSIVCQIKNVFTPEYLNVLLTMPINNFQRYIGDITSVFIKIVIYNFAILYPTILCYGGASGLIDPIYIFTSMFAVLFMPIMPFSLSLIAAIPFIFLAKLLKNKEKTKLVLVIILFVAILTIYGLILSALADWYINAKLTKDIMQGIGNLLDNMNKWYNPAWYSSIICLNWKLGWAFLIHAGCGLVFSAIGVGISYPIYRHMSLAGSTESIPISRHVKYDSRNAYSATFIKDFKEIIRTPSYAYFFFGAAICMPVLTFLIMDTVKKLGEAKVGPETFFGLCLLVVMVICSLIGSYSANLLSKEQNEFYISKIAPVNIKKYLLTKMAVTFTVGVAGLLLCIIVLACTSLKPSSDASQAVLTPTNLAVLSGTCLFFLVGINFNGLNLNLGRPAVNLKGEPNESNIAIQLAIGIVISIIISMLALFASAIVGKQTALLYVIVLAVAFVYAVINIVIFLTTAKKRFNSIEVK